MTFRVSEILRTGGERGNSAVSKAIRSRTGSLRPKTVYRKPITL